MKKEDFDLVKNKFSNDCKTKSINEAVLEVYAFLLEHERSDSDYWTVGKGDDDLVGILEYHTQGSDWIDLEADLINWSTDQLEIFTLCIVSGRGVYDRPGYAIRSHDFGKIKYAYEYAEGKSTINQRIYLLDKLIQISKQSERGSNEIIEYVYDNSEIFKEAIDLPFKIVDAIANNTGFYNPNRHKDEFTINLTYALEKAIR